MPRILGIDLGTTNSVMAVMDKNGPIVVPNSLGERITPSVVGFSKSGDILVGKKAKRGAIMNVGRTVFSIKRHMGTSHRVTVEGKEYTPQEISSMILAKMKQDASDYFGEDIREAVVTVPAYFTQTQREATKDAGEIAGFHVHRVIDEPTAAALAYGLEKSTEQKLMVYDLGGGTFDVSIIEIMDDVFHVQAISGNSMLGGDDFDKRISDHLVAQFQEQHGVDLSRDPIAMQRIREAAEEAKIELSELKETHVIVEAITMTEKGPLTLDLNLTRADFDRLTEDLVQATVEPMEKALKDSKLKVEDLSGVLLVGGSTRIPSVQKLVREFTGRNAARDISPEEVVALGAAVQTLTLTPKFSSGVPEEEMAQPFRDKQIVVVHTTPFSIGVGLKGNQFSPIIERNSTYPTEGKDIFTTTRDFQEAISFPIFEGEETNANDNTFLDLLRIENITPAPKGVPRIEVTFRLNKDRILEVSAEDLATGVSQRIVVNATDNRLSPDEKNRMMTEANDRVTKALQHRIAESRSDEARAMLERAEEILSREPEHEHADQLRAAVESLHHGIETGRESEMEDSIDVLLTLLSEIEGGA